MLSTHKVQARLSAAAAGLVLVMLAGPVAAASEEATAVAVRHVNLAPETNAEANQLLGALGKGALEACGASPFSLAEYRRAVRDSACWQTSMADVVQRIDNPRLTAAFSGRGLPNVISTSGDTSGGR